MKQTWASAVIAGVFACTAVLGAQTSSARKASSRAAGTQTQQQQTITLTGCLQDNGSAQTTASASAPGAAATSRATRANRSQANSYPTYMLANASESAGTNATATSGSTASRSVGTAGTSPSSGAGNGSPAASTGNGPYILQGMDLTREVGQRVEVTGTIMPPPRASRSRARGTSGTTSPEENQNAQQRVRVSSVKMISPNCSGQ